MFVIGETDHSRTAMGTPAIVPGGESIETNRPDATACQMIECGRSNSANSDYYHVVMRQDLFLPFNTRSLLDLVASILSMQRWCGDLFQPFSPVISRYCPTSCAAALLIIVSSSIASKNLAPFLIHSCAASMPDAVVPKTTLCSLQIARISSIGPTTSRLS